MVLATYLAPPVPEFSRAVAALTMAVPVRVARVAVRLPYWWVTHTQPGADHQSSEVRADVKAPADSAALWRLAVGLLALDEQGQVIGFTKWEPVTQYVRGSRSRAA